MSAWRGRVYPPDLQRQQGWKEDGRRVHAGVEIKGGREVLRGRRQKQERPIPAQLGRMQSAAEGEGSYPRYQNPHRASAPCSASNAQEVVVEQDEGAIRERYRGSSLLHPTGPSRAVLHRAYHLLPRLPLDADTIALEIQARRVEQRRLRYSTCSRAPGSLSTVESMPR